MWGIPVVGWVASFVILPSIDLGIIMIYLNMVKGDRPDIGRMFDGFQNVGPCVILFLLTKLLPFYGLYYFSFQELLKRYAILWGCTFWQNIRK